MATEAVIPKDGFLDLETIIADDEEGAEVFRITRNLVEVNILSNFDNKRALAQSALSGFWGTPIEVLTITTDDEVFAYIRMNGIEDATFFVGTVPPGRPAVEPPPTEREMNALRKFEAMSRKRRLPPLHPV